MVKCQEDQGNIKGAIDVESDCEGGTQEGTSEIEEGNQEKARAVLLVGSFSAYGPSIPSLLR